jgi:hypothetical protein
MTPEQEEKLQNFVAVCKRLEPCATEIKGSGLSLSEPLTVPLLEIQEKQ